MHSIDAGEASTVNPAKFCIWFLMAVIGCKDAGQHTPGTIS